MGKCTYAVFEVDLAFEKLTFCFCGDVGNEAARFNSKRYLFAYSLQVM